MMNLPVRIFDKNTKMMLYPEEAAGCGILLSPDGKPVQLKRGWFSVTMAYLKDCIVMHRTPHRDVNREYLWEGDICDFDIPTGFGSVTGCRGLMVWDTGLHKWNVSIVSPKNMLVDGFHVGLINLRRVGDLYMTPELMKQPYGTEATK